MDFGIIAPIGIMKDVVGISATSMYLYHMFDDKQYKKRFQEDSNYRIVDNGVFELSSLPSDEKYILRILDLHPEEIIAPDVPHEVTKTIELTNNFIEKYERDLKGISIQAVVQAKTLREAVECYKEYSENQSIATIGLPFRMNFGNSKRGRSELIGYLIKSNLFNPKKSVHLLGFSFLEEIIELSKLGIIRSCDSSKFYRHASQGISYHENIPFGNSNEPLNFYEGGKQCLKLLKENMRLLREKIRE